MKATDFKTVLAMSVPVLALGGAALYLSRSQPAPARDEGTFRVTVEGVRREKLTATNAQNGTIAAFQVVLNARGNKPAWWGQPTQGRCSGSDNPKYQDTRLMTDIGGKARKWNGKYSPWTAQWDEKSGRYLARLDLESEPPRASNLRWSGKLQLGECDTPALTEPIAFDVELKKAGEQWPKAKFAREPGVTVRSVKIRRVDAKNYRTEIVFFVPRADTPSFGMEVDFVDPKDQHVSLHDKAGYLTPLFHSSECCRPANDARGQSIDSSRLQQGILNWTTYDMQRAPRDVFAKVMVTLHNNWPLEVLIPVKRDGKLLQGAVPIQARPAPIETD